MKYVQQIQVTDEEDKLPMAVVTVADYDKVWLNDKGIQKGYTLRIHIGHRKNNRKMFVGKITFINANFPVEGYPTLEINAMEAIDLMKERKARTFKNMKVSDVILKMLKECGLQGDVQDTKVKLNHINQDNEADLEFISRWRYHYGWHFYKKSNGRYYFGEKAKNGTVKTLGYKTGGMEIISFEPTYQELQTDEIAVQEVDNKTGSTTTSAIKKPSTPTSKSTRSKAKKVTVRK